jgi:hypothetical protein
VQEYKSLYLESKRFQVDIRSTDKRNTVSSAFSINERRIKIFQELFFQVQYLTKIIFLVTGMDPDNQEAVIPEDMIKFFSQD